MEIIILGTGCAKCETTIDVVHSAVNEAGIKVHLSTTDPANHLAYVNTKVKGISVSHIDEKAVLEAYKKEVLDKAKAYYYV